MPRQKDLKRLTRSRMKKTGESYTTARARILAKPRATKTVEPTRAAIAPADYAQLAGMSDATLKARTGCTWERWVNTLDALGADKLAHRDIAALVNGKYKIDGWWAQTVTVGYERIKGLRARGQRRGGAYEASKSKTFYVPVDVLFDAFADPQTRRRWLAHHDPKIRTASRPRSLRMSWDDGTVVSVWFTSKGDTKSAVAVTHQKLPDRAASDRFKQYWSKQLAVLGEALARR